MEKVRKSLYADLQKRVLISEHFRATSRKVGKIEKFTIYFSSEMFDTCSNFLETIGVDGKYVLHEIRGRIPRDGAFLRKLDNDVNITQYQMIKRFVYDQLGVDE